MIRAFAALLKREIFWDYLLKQKQKQKQKQKF